MSKVSIWNYKERDLGNLHVEPLPGNGFCKKSLNASLDVTLFSFAV